MKLIPAVDCLEFVELELQVSGVIKGTKVLSNVKYKLDIETKTALILAFDRVEITGSCKGLIALAAEIKLKTGLPVICLSLSKLRNMTFYVGRNSLSNSYTLVSQGKCDYHHQFSVKKGSLLYNALVREIYWSPWQEGTWV